MSLLQICERLNREYSLTRGWPEGDWPCGGRFRPPRFEVVVGAILTQNTSWKNVEKALEGMIQGQLVDARAVAEVPVERLEVAIRASGFYRQKARRLKEMATFIFSFPGNFYRRVTREQLLAVQGVGPETADSILLYACGRPNFVVDAYTRRLFSRYGLLDPGAGYDEIKSFVESRLSPDVRRYRRFHALIVEHAKQTCRKTPLCHLCVLRRECAAGISRLEDGVRRPAEGEPG